MRMQIFGRKEELAELERRLNTSRSFMFHGPAGVGKSRLLDEIVADKPHIVRLSSGNTPQAIIERLGVALWQKKNVVLRRYFRSIEQLKIASAVNLKGICLLALKEWPAKIVLENVGFSSRQLVATIKQLETETNVPVIFVSRSSHMDDSGYLVRHYLDRSERYELKEFTDNVAREFAGFVANELDLQADNRDEFLAKVVEHSGGNPGSIIAMIQMGLTSKYRSYNSVKSTLLYVDFRLSRNGS